MKLLHARKSAPGFRAAGGVGAPESGRKLLAPHGPWAPADPFPSQGSSSCVETPLVALGAPSRKESLGGLWKAAGPQPQSLNCPLPL